ncbi:two-component system VirA-like sensor kinase [Belnapia sp. F-4-1]|uniref:two-component system VirA-like sensor kinase n=1 Tax=Belnapia sp. F-4-1 TaxID=1545443 RepID=UPI00210162AD|nr:two-component system VirA-like sensor kinase [Belnapia sp. F-4-1]
MAAVLLLLTWLLLRGFAVDGQPIDTAMQLLDEIELAEAAMRRDLLSARVGLLRDYDPLVRAEGQVEAAITRLRELATPAHVERLETWRVRQQALVEASKSANALLQNSLAQFGRLTARLSAPSGSGVPLAGAGRLGSAMLHLTLDTSAPVLEEVRRGLAYMGQKAATGSEVEPAAALLAHGWLLHDLLPRADGLLRDLFANASGPAREMIATELQARRNAQEAVARRYRLLLYASALLLLGGLLLLGVRLRAKSLAMQRHLAFEHMLARLSARLIGTSQGDSEASLGQALEEIARRLGAQRAYLLIAGKASRAHLWAEDGKAPTPGWREAAIAVAARYSPSAAGTLSLPPQHPGLRDMPGRPYACFAVVRRLEGNITALLGCDLTRPGRVPSEEELGSLGLALDAVLNLVTRSCLEAERMRLAAQEAQSRQMQVLGTFASGIAHNFNNIIGAIMGFAEMAQAEPSGARIGDIRRAAERARDLTSDILTFGGQQPKPQGEVDVRSLLAETATLVRAMLPAEVRLVVDPPREVTMVLGDATRLQQVIVNLCRNAAQAMGGGGEITIEVEARILHAKLALRLGELRPDHYLLIHVLDTGPGMDEPTLGRIFEPFFTTRPAGHGLGLATVREIVLAHGGGIAVQSAPAQGSRFEVWLPRAIAAEAARRELPRGEGGLVLLLHDDDRLPHEEELLAALGYEPRGFRAAAAALEALRGAPHRFEAALLPEGTPELARAIRRAAPGLPVILAGVPQMADVHCISWPLRAEELAATLHRSLARSTRPTGQSRSAVASPASGVGLPR